MIKPNYSIFDFRRRGRLHKIFRKAVIKQIQIRTFFFLRRHTWWPSWSKHAVFCWRTIELNCQTSQYVKKWNNDQNLVGRSYPYNPSRTYFQHFEQTWLDLRLQYLTVNLTFHSVCGNISSKPFKSWILSGKLLLKNSLQHSLEQLPSYNTLSSLLNCNTTYSFHVLCSTLFSQFRVS